MAANDSHSAQYPHQSGGAHQSNDDPPPPGPPRKRTRRRWLIVGILFGLTLGAVWSLRRDADPLTRESLSAAKVRWGRADLSNYDLELQVRGAQHGVIKRNTASRRISRLVRRIKAMPA